MEGEGFEPSKAEPSDLQSDPFDRSGTPPNETKYYEGLPNLRQLISSFNDLGVCRTQGRKTPKAKPAAGKKDNKYDPRANLPSFFLPLDCLGKGADLHFRPVLLLPAYADS